MNRVSALATTWLLFVAPTAMAGGINFAWGSGCWTENPANLRVFYCTGCTLSGLPFTGSFVPTNDQPHFVGVEVVVDIQASSPTLPAWWEFFNPGSCRQSSLSTSADFTASPQTSCTDPWAGLGAGGIAAYQTATTSPPVPGGLANAARLKVVYALADPSPLSEGIEYYGFRGMINFQKTLGTGACPGCTTPVTLVLNEIKAAENTGSSERISSPLANQCLHSQAVSPSLCDATPVPNRTWGQVKTRYR